MNRETIKGNVFHILQTHLLKLELSNEYIFHNKVHKLKNIQYTKCIPKGKELLIWFKHNYSRNENNCYLIYRKRNKICTIDKINILFDKFLTIENGTLIHCNEINESLFVLRDILYYKGINMRTNHYKKRLETILYMLEYQIYSKSIFFTTCHKQGKVNIDKFDIPYQIFSLEYIDKHGNSYLEKVSQQKIKNNYIVVADTQNDIYHAYTLQNKYIGILNIPDYKTSCLMNSVYRYIRENENIDYIEESEDEEDFQNIQDNKYIKKDMKCIIECEFIDSFKMWKPLRIISNL